MSAWSYPPPARCVQATPRDGVGGSQVRWDEKLGVALASHRSGLSPTSAEEIERWRAELYEELGAVLKQRNGKFPIVVSVDGLYIRPGVAELYGRVVSSYSERFASGLGRYVHKPNGVGQIITVAAMKEGYRANLFMSRAEAISHALAEASGGKPKTGV